MRTIGIVTAAACWALGTACHSQPADRITSPDWLKRPTRENLIGVWPKAALRRPIDGRVVIDCVVTLQGGLRDCRVASETPAGLGFGEAALALTPQFAFRPGTKDGVAIESEITIPIHFPKLDDGHFSRDTSQMDRAMASTPVVTITAWESAPSIADVVAAYPPRAREAKESGRTTLSCNIARGGRLSSCESIMETPKGQGFGAAARSLASKFQAPVKDSAGKSIIGHRVDIQVAFTPDLFSESKPIIGKPKWVSLPTSDDVYEAIGKPFAAKGVLAAGAVLRCSVTSKGMVTDCIPDSETPSGTGLAQAVVSLADRFRITNWTPEGLPTAGGQVKIPFRYVAETPAEATQP